jgi:hypothetical protein
MTAALPGGGQQFTNARSVAELRTSWHCISMRRVA